QHTRQPPPATTAAASHQIQPYRSWPILSLHTPQKNPIDPSFHTVCLLYQHLSTSTWRGIPRALGGNGSTNPRALGGTNLYRPIALPIVDAASLWKKVTALAPSRNPPNGG